ncbi:MAG: transposase [Verrucomicrobiota bacterium]
MSTLFLNPHESIDQTQHRLPHWQQDEVYVFATCRLDDALPQSKLKAWTEEKQIWLAQHPLPWDEHTEEVFHERFSISIDQWLDRGAGKCYLRDSDLAEVVAAALHHFDGARYDLDSFVVMPNHVHVLFQPKRGETLAKVMKSWKGYTSRELNRRLGRSGRIWQEDYWDRLIRSQRHLAWTREYIRQNPVKARLTRISHRAGFD